MPVKVGFRNIAADLLGKQLKVHVVGTKKRPLRNYDIAQLLNGLPNIIVKVSQRTKVNNHGVT